MSLGEVVTKLAIILTAVSAAQGGVWSSSLAWKLGGTLLAISFVRDANLQWREAVRMTPGFGFWFVVTCLLVVPTNAILKKLIGLESWGFTYWESVAASGILAMIFRVFLIACESCSRWFFWLIGFDNRRLDVAHRYLQNDVWEKFFGAPSEPEEDYEEWDEEPDDQPEVRVTVVDGQIADCPVCFLPWDGSPTCEVCGHRFLPQAISHTRQARLN
jgi:hypothetical protein